MESFHRNPEIGEVPPSIPHQIRTRRKEGIRWYKVGKEIRPRGDVRRKGKTVELIDHRLRETFPGTIIKTHPQPRKK